jgi:hypothetical protein
MDYYHPKMTYKQDHLVEVQLQHKDFKATVVYAAGGNIAGAVVLQSAIDNFANGHMRGFPTENENNLRHLDLIDPEADYSGADVIFLYREDGSNVPVAISYQDEKLRNLVVSAKIIEYQEE